MFFLRTSTYRSFDKKLLYVFCVKREKILINVINFGKKLAMLYKKINSEVVQ